MLRGHTFFGDSSQGSSMTIQATKRLRISAYLSASLLLVFGLVAVFPVASSMSNVNAAKKSLEQTTLSMTSSSFYVNPKVTSATGTFTSSSTEISVSTDNYTGYTIGIAAKTDDSDYSKLKSVDGELNSISSATSEEDFSSVSGTSFNGLWGYKPSMLSSTANTYFLPAPTFAGDELNRTNSANEQADTYTISLGARADASLPYGRYQNEFVLRTVANPIGVSFVYNKNTEDTVTNMPANIAANISDEKIVISNTIPERSGYKLVGWCDGASKNVLNIDYCEGDFFEGGDDYYLDRSGAVAEVNLYAMWKPAGSNDFVCNSAATSINEAVCMQDMNRSVRASMATEQQYRLFDSRDGKKYYVSKLADGNVWMTQDLNYMLSSQTTLTHADTDLGWTNYDENASFTPMNDTINDKTLWREEYVAPQSFDVGTKYYVPSRTNGSDHSYASLSECEEVTGSESECEHGKAGTLYSYAAAVAVNDPDTDYLKANNSLAPDSICPAGWRLPYGTFSKNSSLETTGDYGRLLYAYEFIPEYSTDEYGGRPDSTIAALESSPFFFIRNGYINHYSNGHSNKGGFAYYLTNTSYVSGDYYAVKAFSFYTRSSADDGNILTETTLGKTDGYSVRCLARDSATITFDANGGEGTMSPITIYANAYLPENQFTKEGKSFVGWNTAADGSGTSYGLEYASDVLYPLRDNKNDVTLYAQWENKTVITYDGNNADSGSVETQYVNYKQEIQIAANGFVRDGYDFYGWNTAADGSGVDYGQGEKFTAENIEGENITLYAKWRAVRIHTVNYISSAGTDVVKYACSGGSYLITKYSHTENVDDTGLQLYSYGEGWSEANIAGSDRGDKSQAHVVTIPGATQIDVTVYFNGEGTSYDWVTMWQGKHPEYTAKDNYNSSGVYWQRLGGGGSYSPTVNGNTLNWVNYYSATIDGDSVTFGFKSDGSGSGNGYGYYAIVTGYGNDFGCSVSEGTYPSVEDTSTGGFTGWATYNNANVAEYYTEQEIIDVLKWRDSYTSSRNHNFYAAYGKWTNITFDANDGSGNTSTQRIAYLKTNALNKNTFTREGYDFSSWNEQPDGSGINYDDEYEYTASVAGGTSITLYAQWTPKAEYTVNYHNGDSVNTVKYNCWDGRYTNKRIAHSANVDDSGVQTGNLNTYYGYTSHNKVLKFPSATKLHIKLTYGTTSINNAYVVIWQGDESNNLDPYSYAQYGIKLGDNTTGKYGGTGENGENLVIEGDVAGDTITVGFLNQYNGSSYDNGYGYYLEVTTDRDTMLCESEPTEGQYVAPVGDPNDVFTGWSFDNTDTLGSYMSELETKSALTTDNTVVDVYAIWAKPTILKFNNNGGNGAMNDITVKYGEAITMPMNKFTYDSDSDVKFYSWNDASGNTGTRYEVDTTYSASDPVGGNKQIYAIWGMPTYYHFDANGGQGENFTIKVPYHTYDINVPGCQFTKENASFYRWFNDPNDDGTQWYNQYNVGNTLYADNVMGEEITIYATWGYDTIFHFEANGGLGEMPDYHAQYNRSCYLPDVAFGRAGAKFSNWNTSVDNTGTSYSNKAYCSDSGINGGEITLYAIWGWPATLHFEPNGGTGEMEDIIVPYNQNIYLPAVGYSKEGTVFAYWNTESNHTGVRYDNQAEYVSNNTDYVGTLYLYAIWGYPTYFVYHANGGEGTMETHRVDYNTDFAFDTNTFTNSGKRFVGWNTQPDGTGTSYANQHVYHTGNVDGETINLYAIWASDSTPAVGEYTDQTTGRPGITIARAYEIAYTAAGKGMYVPHKDPNTGEYDGTYFEATSASDYSGIPASDLKFAMHDMTTAICQSVTVTWDDYRALDVRDNKVYHITKMNDGSCWMTQNLDFNFTSDGNGGVTPLTSKTSDLNVYGTDQYNASTGYSYEDGVISWTPLRATTTISSVTNNRINSIYSTANGAMSPFSADVGNWYWKPHVNNLYRYVGMNGHVLEDHTDDRPFLSGPGVPDYFQKNTAYEENGEHGSVGNYYNWTAAVATNDGESFDFDSVMEWNRFTDQYDWTYDQNLNAKNSICPKGWRLPRYDAETGDARSLYEAWSYVDSNPMYEEPYYFVRAGRIYIDGNYSVQTAADYSADLTTSDSSHTVAQGWNGVVSTTYGHKHISMYGDDRYLSNIEYAGGRTMSSVRCIAR